MKADGRLSTGVTIEGPRVPGSETILTPDALEFVAQLHRSFEPVRKALLERRVERQAEIDAGSPLGLLADTAAIRADPRWRVAEPPPDLLDRRVEITGPAEPKMIINALNSGARAFMADFEDSLSPTWENVVGGQAALGRRRPRHAGVHLPRGQVATASGIARRRCSSARAAGTCRSATSRSMASPSSASLFDFGLYAFHNARERLRRGSGLYLYLPKLQSHGEARLWNDVFVQAEAVLGIPRGTIRATVLIETIHAAFEMEEILYELREHSSGLNAGRWDYLFSCIKTFRGPDAPVPARTAPR